MNYVCVCSCVFCVCVCVCVTSLMYIVYLLYTDTFYTNWYGIMGVVLIDDIMLLYDAL